MNGPFIRIHQWLILAFVGYVISLRGAAVQLQIDVATPGEKIDLTAYALGQGGLSDKPMFDPHVEQLAQLHPQNCCLQSVKAAVDALHLMRVLLQAAVIRHHPNFFQ